MMLMKDDVEKGYVNEDEERRIESRYRCRLVAKGMAESSNIAKMSCVRPRRDDR
jgi:hypothetical protein